MICGLRYTDSVWIKKAMSSTDYLKLVCSIAIRGSKNLCLDEENANLLGYDFNKEISERVGFMSFRFMKLSLQFPMEKINQCIKEGLSLDTLEPKFITKLEIKNEILIKELKKLSLDLFPEYFDVIKVQKFFEENSKINASQTPKTIVDSLTDDTLERMWSKEWLLLSRY